MHTKRLKGSVRVTGAEGMSENESAEAAVRQLAETISKRLNMKVVSVNTDFLPNAIAKLEGEGGTVVEITLTPQGVEAE